MRRRHVANRRWEETSHLNQVGIIRWGEGKMRERKRKESKKKKKEEMSEKLHFLSRIYGD